MRPGRLPLALCLLFLAGCFGPRVIPTKGTLKADGKAVEGATVTFLSQETGGRDATGFTDANGAFRLTTFQANDGALPGKYKVVVQAPTPLVIGPKARTPEEAQNAAGEGTTVQAPTVIIAERFSQPGQTPLEQMIPAKGDVVLDVQSK